MALDAGKLCCSRNLTDAMRAVFLMRQVSRVAEEVAGDNSQKGQIIILLFCLLFLSMPEYLRLNYSKLNVRVTVSGDTEMSQN